MRILLVEDEPNAAHDDPVSNVQDANGYAATWTGPPHLR